MKSNRMWSSLYPEYNTVIGFGEIWQSADEFLEDCKNADIPLVISEKNCKILFYMLYARKGNTPIINDDVTQFKYRVFTTIWQYGGEWQKKLDIEEKLKELSLESGELFERTKAILNSASNPSVAPGTGTDEELSYINSQNVSKTKMSKLEAYGFLFASLDSKLNEQFLKHFDPFFKKFLSSDVTDIYATDIEEY